MKNYTIFKHVSALIFFCTMLIACGGGGSSENTPSNLSAEPPNNTNSTTPTNTSSNTNVGDFVSSFAIFEEVSNGIDGKPITTLTPIALFKDGRALLDVATLINPGKLDEHRNRFPQFWTQWRASGVDVEIRNVRSGNWLRVKNEAVNPLPIKGTALIGSYHQSTRIPVMSSFYGFILDSTERSSDYKFYEDGKVIRGNYFTRRGTDHVPPRDRGKYIVDGFILYIAYEDGSQEVRSIAIDKRDSLYIFIDGITYFYSSN